MKTSTTFGRATVIAFATGALCATLLWGCGNAATSQAADPPAAQGSSVAQESTASKVDSSPGDATTFEGRAGEGHSTESELMSPALGYHDLTSFLATTADGKTFTQDDLARADVTLINFWGVYCPYCLEEMPSIAAWAKTLPNNVQVVTVCTDYESDPESAKGVLEEAGLTCPTLVRGTGDLEELLSDVAFLPTTLVVDRTGKVVGDVLEGAPQNLGDAYSQMVGNALKSQGKA